MQVTLALPRADRVASLPNHIVVVYRPPVSASVATPHATPQQRLMTRVCVRPGCMRRATTTLRFDYGQRVVMLDPLGSHTEPGEYDLCFQHAARSTPPTGWTLRDRAPSREQVTEAAPPVGPDRGQGVARLAAALSAVQWAVSEDAPDAAPDGTDRSAAQRRASGAGRLDSLLQPSAPSAPVAPVPLSERTPEAEVRPVPQPLRLAPDPTKTVWCADLLTPATRPGAPAVVSPPAPFRVVPSGTSVASLASVPSATGQGGTPTLFG